MPYRGAGPRVALDIKEAQMKRQRSLSALLIGGLLLVVACGDDDDTDPADTEGTTASQSADAPSTDAPSTDAPSTESPSTDAPSTDPPTTDSPSTDAPSTDAAGTDPTSAGSVDAFCQAELDVEAATASQDPEAIEPAFAALQEAAPEDISDAVETAIAEAEKFLAAGGMPTPEFDDAYAEVVGFVSDNCGFGALDVLAKDYSFGGIGPEVPAGPTVVSLVNDGTEVHEIIIIRKNDDVTESFDELLELPERQARRKTTFAGAAFADPGEDGQTVLDLEAGEYIALCFIPKGTTPEVMADMESGGSEPQGPPHFVEGMKHEFVVS